MFSNGLSLPRFSVLRFCQGLQARRRPGAAADGRVAKGGRGAGVRPSQVRGAAAGALSHLGEYGIRRSWRLLLVAAAAAVVRHD